MEEFQESQGKIRNPKTGRIVIDSAKNEAWREAYQRYASKHRQDNLEYGEYANQLAHLLGEDELRLLQKWTVAQAALYFGVSPATVYGWIHHKDKNGKPQPLLKADISISNTPFSSNTGRILIDIEEVDRIVEIGKKLTPELRRYMPRVVLLADELRKQAGFENGHHEEPAPRYGWDIGEE